MLGLCVHDECYSRNAWCTLVFGITICCTWALHIVYDRFPLLLLLIWLLSPLGIWYHHLLDTNTAHCLWYVSLSTGIVMSSLPFRYLVSPFVAHEHYALCMIGFLYYWYWYCSCATDGDTKYLKERDDISIPVVKETYHTQCVVFMCNKWWYQIPKGERRHHYCHVFSPL
jgi:hypothetical protein